MKAAVRYKYCVLDAYNIEKPTPDAATAVINQVSVQADVTYLAPVQHRRETDEPRLVKHAAQLFPYLREKALSGPAEAISKIFFTLFNQAI